jgi:hypothetical protein
MDELPKDWNVPTEIVADKLKQLFDKSWTSGVWKNFVECLNDNIGYE